MDDRSFDDLTRAISQGTSRRAMLKGVIGGSLAALLAAIGLDDADAQELDADARCGRCRRIKNRRRRRRCSSRCRRGGGGGGTAATPGPTSTTVNGFLVGASCATTSQCNAGLVCYQQTCRACSGACAGSAPETCCAVGLCDVSGESDVCVLG